LRAYIAACEAGRIYEDVLAEARRAGLSYRSLTPPRHRRLPPDRPLSRDDVKHGMLTATFARTSTTRQMPLFHVFAQMFPTVAKFIEAEKQGEHQALARRCQRFESGLMIDTVAQRLMGRSESMPIFTVHDSIVTAARNAKLIANEIRQAFAQFGATPTIRLTDRTGIIIDC
jgi:hypothetical protein